MRATAQRATIQCVWNICNTFVGKTLQNECLSLKQCLYFATVTHFAVTKDTFPQAQLHSYFLVNRWRSFEYRKLNILHAKHLAQQTVQFAVEAAVYAIGMYDLANRWQPMQARQQCLYQLAFTPTWLVQVQRRAHVVRRHNPVFAVGIPKAVEPVTVGKVEYVIESGHL